MRYSIFQFVDFSSQLSFEKALDKKFKQVFGLKGLGFNFKLEGPGPQLDSTSLSLKGLGFNFNDEASIAESNLELLKALVGYVEYMADPDSYSPQIRTTKLEQLQNAAKNFKGETQRKPDTTQLGILLGTKEPNKLKSLASDLKAWLDSLVRRRWY
jgi:hypothetical protein